MKKLSILLSGIITLLFISCSGSDTYRGSWKGMDPNGIKFDINFEAKSFTVKDSTGRTQAHEYSQNSVSIENSITTYGIQLSDGRNYQIHFPIADNDSIGLIKDGSGNPIYTIARKSYIAYDEIYKLN